MKVHNTQSGTDLTVCTNSHIKQTIHPQINTLSRAVLWKQCKILYSNEIYDLQKSIMKQAVIKNTGIV